MTPEEVARWRALPVEIWPIGVVRAEVESLQAENASLRKLARELLLITEWAQECVPGTLVDQYGDVGPTVERAEKLLGSQ